MTDNKSPQKNVLTNRSSLTTWLHYLESIHTKEIDLGLTRIELVAKKLNISFQHSKVITVAGTNGKGTTCAFIENALLAEGKSVGVYSSPHLIQFNERIRVNKKDVDDQSIVDAFVTIEQQRQETSLTYYEYTTLAAQLIFMALQPDVILLEVGLGGRLDATNIIEADIAVLTAIDLDHQSFLGDNREAIGYEKAGIMSPQKPAIVGDTNIPQSVLQHGKKIAAELICRGNSFDVKKKNSANGEQYWQYENKRNNFVLSNLIPPHIPIDNVATALTVLHTIGISLSSTKVNNIIANTKVSGRTEFIRVKSDVMPDVMFDVGHNPQATRYLAAFIQEKGYKSVRAVAAMLADKDIEGSLEPLINLTSQWYMATLDVPRGATKEVMAKALPNSVNSVFCFDNVLDAYKMALEDAKLNELVLIFGSFYTVAFLKESFS